MKKIILSVPGSKSLTNRAIVMASLSNGLSKISNISNSLDSQIMIKAMKKLGVKIEQVKNQLQIIGNQGVFPKFIGKIDVGNAGTAARFLTALCCLVPGRVVFNKSRRMRERPIKELIEALKKIRTGKISIKGNISSQFISSLLMIAPTLNKGLTINISGQKISSSYIDMTIDLMKKFGVEVKKIGDDKYVIKKQLYRQTNYLVESDLSGASYFFAAAAITGKTIKIKNVNPKSVQGDRFFPDLLERMGCQVRKNIKEKWIEVKGPKILRGITVDMVNMPDTAQTLAVVAAFAKGKTKITGLSTLKIKETNRLLALKNELDKMGIKSQTTNSSITIYGGNPKKAVIETYGDHRMAMAFAVAKLRIPELIIKNPEVVKKSFPEFWEKWRQI
ncbi:3-phosphoshikimate 1-carboxyvinyltransferase [Candidatus Roizmanbacteria bacterium]|nr:3-phosphoshikimate 1-carboxyvinyltransferase [Candidatus Roizmanbacteria bacterium]